MKRKYVAKIGEDLWLEFTAEQYISLTMTTMVRKDKEVSCKIIPIGDNDSPKFWILFPVKSFLIVKE